MTRVLTVANIKGVRSAKTAADGMPREGSLIRRYYDDLRKGLEVHFPKSEHNLSTLKQRLMDEYGMVLRKVRPGHYVLVSENVYGEVLTAEHIAGMLAE